MSGRRQRWSARRARTGNNVGKLHHSLKRIWKGGVVVKKDLATVENKGDFRKKQNGETLVGIGLSMKIQRKKEAVGEECCYAFRNEEREKRIWAVKKTGCVYTEVV